MSESHLSASAQLTYQNRTDALRGIQRGIEKEGLRVDPNGFIAQTPHAAALGSTLTHSSITTDYSEALLEFISPVLNSVEGTVKYLTDLHSYTLRNIGDEVVWPASMPCKIDGDESIPIALYGSSNVGQMKHVYRQGLAVRYGRIMQSIAGVHYNFSLPEAFWIDYQKQRGNNDSLCDFKSNHYFSLIRNFRRYSWLLHYLFGASPVLDASFLNGMEHDLEQFQPNTYGLKYGTSLRMSDLGYQNSAQEDLQVSYNSLDDYVTTLGQAVRQTYPPYEEMGTQVDGKYIQLNTNILQLENEYYSDIRPKRVTQSGEKPIYALRTRGVEYIEVRILDINPFLAEGIDAQQIRFLDAFLLFCLVSTCPKQSLSNCDEIKTNQSNIIMSGRDPELTMIQEGQTMPFKTAANQLLDCVLKTSALLDEVHSSNDYAEAVMAQRDKVADSELTPSGQVMTKVQAGTEFLDLANEQANQHKRYFTGLDAAEQMDTELSNLASQSLQEQETMERSDTESFDDYLAAYNASS